MIIGAHISSSGNLLNIFAKAKILGIDCIQCFASPPTNWSFKDISDETATEFTKTKNEYKISPIFFHGIYLMNFASTNPYLIEQSQKSLINYLNLSVKLKINGVIFHLGSTKDKTFQDRFNDLLANLQYVLEHSNPRSILIFENSAGAGGTIGRKIEEFEKIISKLKQYKNRIKFCFDTCHAFASGYDFTTQNGVESLKAEIDKSIGLQNVVAIHANDSRGSLGENKDRHENIGNGKIGLNGFKMLAQDNFFNSLPWILEVPGFENTGPDTQNIKILKSLM